MCKSRNSYMVSVNNKLKHVSGDHMTLVPKDSNIDHVNDSDMTMQIDQNSVTADKDSNSETKDFDSEYCDFGSSVPVNRESNSEIKDFYSDNWDFSGDCSEIHSDHMDYNVTMDYNKSNHSLNIANSEQHKGKKYFFSDNESICSDLSEISLPKLYSNTQTRGGSRILS